VIVLDTNVISELVRGPNAERRVLTWIRSLREPPTTTVVNRAEVLAGIALMPAGRRRELIASTTEAAFAHLGVVLPLVQDCAPAYAAIVAERQSVGRPIEPMDALIASICRVSGATLATRNTADFEDIGLDVVDPWT
jgi:predicted nucleic acid-binding protein